MTSTSSGNRWNDNGKERSNGSTTNLNVWVDEFVIDRDHEGSCRNNNTSSQIRGRYGHEEMEKVAEEEEEEEDRTLAAVQNHDTQQAFDAQLAREMNRLSVQEREQRLEEIHGVRTVEEDPELIAVKLLQLDDEIEKIPYKPNYDKALQINPDYVTNITFKLMFLRASSFHVGNAAKRLLLFLEKKVEHFGTHTLCRSLTMDDLTENELQTLKSGSIQQLNCRDRSGRVIFIDPFIFGPQLYTDIRAHYKCLWYMIICAFEEDEITQKHGMVHIMWYMDHFRGVDANADSAFRRELILSSQWLPMRPLSSIHICIDDSTIKELMSRIVIAISPKGHRYHIQVHKGTQTEVLYRLMSYGIPTQALPVTIDGKLKTTNQKKWIAKRLVKEHAMKVYGYFDSGKINLPTNQDVLLGKGGPIQQHSGNREFRSLIDTLMEEYHFSPLKTDKTALTWKVVEMIQSKGGRFLKLDTDDWWIVASDSEARQKVKKAFGTKQRSEVILRKGQQQQQQPPPPRIGSSPMDVDGNDTVCFGLCNDKPQATNGNSFY